MQTEFQRAAGCTFRLSRVLFLSYSFENYGTAKTLLSLLKVELERDSSFYYNCPDVNAILILRRKGKV